METNPQQPTPEMQTVPVAETVPVKKGPGLIWLLVLLAVGFLGVGAYVFYSLQPKTVEKSPTAIPGIMTQESKTGTGFGTQDSTPPATPTITSSDTVTDIEKDLSGTTVEAGSTTEFDADLQSL